MKKLIEKLRKFLENNYLPKFCKCGKKFGFYDSGRHSNDTGKKLLQWRCKEYSPDDMWSHVNHQACDFYK